MEITDEPTSSIASVMRGTASQRWREFFLYVHQWLATCIECQQRQWKVSETSEVWAEGLSWETACNRNGSNITATCIYTHGMTLERAFSLHVYKHLLCYNLSTQFLWCNCSVKFIVSSTMNLHSACIYYMSHLGSSYNPLYFTSYVPRFVHYGVLMYKSNIV